jgi:elongation factor G
VVAGFPVVDLKVTLVDGVCHPFDSSALAFELAARDELRDALREGAAVVLEPVMNVEVVTPEDCTRLVVGDLNARRGQILGQDVCGNANGISARAPLANMFGYAKILRSISQGRDIRVPVADELAI